MNINCSYCRKEIRLTDYVVIDVVNSIYHGDCYNQFSDNLFEWKDFGEVALLLEKYNIIDS